MDNREFARIMEKRTKEFAIKIIRQSVLLPSIPEGKVLRNQLTKAGTSIGANYREANRSKSKADFCYKIKLCESEANESLYWLEIISDLDWTSGKAVNDLIKENTELLATFTSISKNLNKL